MLDNELEDDIVIDGEPVDDGGDAHEPVDDELSIEIEGEDPVEETPLIKQLRDRTRDLARENAELKKATAPKPIEVGPKPTLESCDYDDERFENELDAWKETTRQAEEQRAQQQQAEQTRNQQFERAVTTYRTQAAQLGVKDFEEAEATIKTTLPELLQSAIVTYAKEPAKVVYALAKHPAKLAQLAAEPDPVRFILAINELERNLKVVNKRRPPTPDAESIQRGSASLSASTDKEAEKLYNAGVKSGDMSAYFKHQRDRRKNGKDAA